MRRVPKSLQAIIITFVVGMFVPKVAELTGIALVDKVFWKILLSLAFNASTIIVGILFSAKLLHGKVEGGKARISIFLTIVIILLCGSSSIIVFFKEVTKVVLIVLAVLAILAIAFLILNHIFAIRDRKTHFKNAQTHGIASLSNNKANTTTKRADVPNTLNVKKSSDEQTIKNEKARPVHNETLKTVKTLWQEFDHQTKYLVITNDVNPDLKWVKICKPQYGNGKFYGYIMMRNARNTVSGEIYYADRPIWKLYENS